MFITKLALFAFALSFVSQTLVYVYLVALVVLLPF